MATESGDAADFFEEFISGGAPQTPVTSPTRHDEPPAPAPAPAPEPEPPQHDPGPVARPVPEQIPVDRPEPDPVSPAPPPDDGSGPSPDHRPVPGTVGGGRHPGPDPARRAGRGAASDEPAPWEWRAERLPPLQPGRERPPSLIPLVVVVLVAVVAIVVWLLVLRGDGTSGALLPAGVVPMGTGSATITVGGADKAPSIRRSATEHDR